MFTKEQIKEAHAKVKTGADYPRYVQDLKKLGVAKYDYWVENGSNVYFDSNGASVNIELIAPLSLPVSDTSSSEKVKEIIRLTQQGKTDFPTFCRQAAEAGVERWTSDLGKMLCSYYDKKGTELYAEPIPEAKY